MATLEAPEFPSSNRVTECTAAQGASPSKKDPETSWVTPVHWAKEKIAHQNRWERLRHIHTINPIPGRAPYNQQGTRNSQLLPEEWKVWTTHQVPQLLRLPPEAETPQTPLSRNPFGLEVYFVPTEVWLCWLLSISVCLECQLPTFYF